MVELLTVAEALTLEGPALSAAVAEVVYGAKWSNFGFLIGDGWMMLNGTAGESIANDRCPHADPAAAERALRRACEEFDYFSPSIEYDPLARKWWFDKGETWDDCWHESLAVVLSRAALVVALSRRGEP